ncbi:MAG: DNA gyrase C-terminal beta-propeller domain-containing protein, partial [Chloroflexota bacterium]
RVVAMDVVSADGQLLVISKRGRGKPTALTSYRRQRRGGHGLKTFRITSESGNVAAAQVVREGQEIIIVSERAQVTRTSLTELREVSRRTQGVWIVKQLQEDDEIVSIAAMESRVRTARDTKPRPANQSLPALVDGLSEESSANGHQEEDEEEEES